MGSLSTANRIIRVTVPGIGLSSAYTSGDQLGTLFTIPGAVADADNAGTLVSVAVVDKELTTFVAMDILFFSDIVTPASVDNGALSLTDADVASYLLGHVNVPAGGAISFTGGSTNQAANTVTSQHLPLVLNSVNKSAGVATGNIYGIIKIASTPTYTVASPLVLVFGIES